MLCQQWLCTAVLRRSWEAGLAKYYQIGKEMCKDKWGSLAYSKLEAKQAPSLNLAFVALADTTPAIVTATCTSRLSLMPAAVSKGSHCGWSLLPTSSLDQSSPPTVCYAQCWGSLGWPTT